MNTSDLRGYAAEVSDLARRLEAAGLVEEGATLREVAFALEVQADGADEAEAQAVADNPPCHACRGYGCGLCLYTGVR